MEHPETWHILPNESNWCEGDPYAVYLENEGEGYCILFIYPIIRDVYPNAGSVVLDDRVEEEMFNFMRLIYDDVVTDNLYCSALTYYLVHELLHWGVSE
jgi:hypothetical protein